MATLVDRINLDRFRSAGYLITRPVSTHPIDPAAAGRATVLPERIVTLSTDRALFVPDAWALRWVTAGDPERERRTACAAFGIDAETLPALMDWVTSRFDAHDIGWPHIFSSLTGARDFARRFLREQGDVLLLGLGVPRELVPEFLAAHRPEPGIGPSGHYEMLRQGNSLAPGGELLGFEVVGPGVGGRYSWLDNGWDQVAARELGIHLGALGLLPTLEEAQRAAAFPYPGPDNEVAALWQPWAIVRYPLW